LNFLTRGIANIILRSVAGRRTGPERVVNPAKFGIAVEDPVCLRRIREILTAFFSGFECGLKRPAELRRLEEAVDPLLRPFFHEGAAMGFVPHGYLGLTPWRKSLLRFEEALGEGDPYVLMSYVGLGFWLGFQYSNAAPRLEARAAELRQTKYRHLLHDGYGFKVGFFDFPRLEPRDLARLEREIGELELDAEDSLDRGNVELASEFRRQQLKVESSLRIDGLRSLTNFGRASAFNGLGRSLWFFTMDRPAHGFALARFLGPDRDAVIGGMGLAAAFTFVDDLSRAYRVAEGLSGREQDHFVKGIRIALYVRDRGDPEYLSGCTDRLPPDLRSRVEADLSRAVQVGKSTQALENFIEMFHEGCLQESTATDEEVGKGKGMEEIRP